MSTTQKSSEIYSIDVPEVKNVRASFQYNYYMYDEGVSEDIRVKDSIKYRETSDFESYMKYITDRTPRFVSIRFSSVRITEHDRLSTDTVTRKFAFNPAQPGLIAKNLSKVVDEDHVSANGFTAIQFHDGDLMTKSSELVSASILQHLYMEDYRSDISQYRKSQLLNSKLPSEISFDLISKSISNLGNQENVSFFKRPTQQERSKQTVDGFFDDLIEVDVHAQVNNKVIHDLVDRMMKNPFEPSTTDVLELKRRSEKTQETAKSSAAFEGSYSVNLPYIDYRKYDPTSSQETKSEVVGYIVDKIEIKSDGAVRLCDPIVVESPNVPSAVDFSVRYGATYMYSVRAVAKVSLVAYDEERDDLFVIDVLVSSKPSNKVYVSCVENCPPAPPADLNFRWDYGYERENSASKGRLFVTWTFPVNPQQDVKKFQIFRRKSIFEPYVLIKEYDFNDNAAPLPLRELPGPGVSEKLAGPRLWYADMDFSKDSEFMYAMACVDAHELSSGYSDQFRVWFDVYENRLKKELISHSGAPKPYPNMYLESDSFIDSITSECHDRVRIYLNPEFYEYQDGQGKKNRVYETVQSGGDYKFHFMSTTALKSQVYTLKVNDKRSDKVIQRKPTSSGYSKEMLSDLTKTSK